MRVYWFRKKPNYGDALAPLLLEKFAGLRARWAHPAVSDGVVIGSVAARLPRHYYGVVVGIGKYSERISLDLSRAHVLGVRGELTLRDSRAPANAVLGDPGLLVRELLDERPHVVHQLGIVPHYNDKSLAARYPEAHYIDVGHDPVAVTREIASCDRVIASSLHGLIGADSLGIPRRWEPSDLVRGAGFKFQDYASALGTTIEPEAWDVAPAAEVDRVVARLRDVFGEIRGALAAEKSRPVHRLVQSVDSVRGWVAKHLPG